MYIETKVKTNKQKNDIASDRTGLLSRFYFSWEGNWIFQMWQSIANYTDVLKARHALLSNIGEQNCVIRHLEHLRGTQGSLCPISQTDVSFQCVCSVNDHEMHHNITEVNIVTIVIVNIRTDAWNTYVNLFFKITTLH